MFSKKTSISNNFQRKNKCDKQNKRRNFAKTFCFIYTVFIFQCELVKYMRTIKIKNINRIRKLCKCVCVQHKHRKKLQNFEKITRRF